VAWIELHQSLWTHKKTFLLAAELGIDELYAAAHMAHLWCWALDNAGDGDISGLPNRAIAFGASWRGDADAFVEACLTAGWLSDVDGHLVLHDWQDYAGRLLERREKNAERMRSARASKVSKRAEHVHNTFKSRAPATVPNRTLPNQTEPKDKNNDDPVHSADLEVAASVEKDSSSSLVIDESLSTLTKVYESEGFGQLTQTVGQALADLLTEFGQEWVTEAMKEAVLQNKRRLKYVFGVLQNWRADGGIRRKTTATAVRAGPQKTADEKDPRYDAFYALYPDG